MTASKTHTGAPTADPTLEQIKELNQQALKTARQAGKVYLESYEWAVDFEHQLAELSQQDWLKDVIEAQIAITRDLSSVYTRAARSLLK